MLKKTLIFAICILYPLHILMDLTGSYTYGDYIKFTVIVCAFFLSLYSEVALVGFALFLTLLCDFTLLFTQYAYFGVTLFSAVQLTYSYILLTKKSSTARFFYCLLAVLPFAYYFAFKGPLVCIFYAAILGSNLIATIRNRRFHLLLAFTLFALCDLCVAGYNLSSNTVFLPLIWIFYTPSQLLLSLSSAKEWQPHKI